MPKKVVVIILLAAIVPLFLLFNFSSLNTLVNFSSLMNAHGTNAQYFGEKRLEYYSEPREVIKIAALGRWSDWDKHNIKLKDTIKFTVDKINSQNKQNKKIVLLWYDNEGSAQKSNDIVDEIIEQEDVFGIIGPFQSSIVSVIKNKIAAANLWQITMTQGDIDLSSPRAKSFFSSTVSVFTEAQAVAQWISQKYGTGAPLVLMHEDDLYSKKYADTLSRKFHNFNLNVIGSLNYARQNTTGHVQRYFDETLNFAPKVKIISIGNAAMFKDFYHYNKKLFQDLKFNDFIINQDSITWDELKLLPNIDKSYIILNYKCDDKLVEVMKELYHEGGIKTTIYIVSHAYRMLFILADAITKSKSNDLNTVLNYMNTQTLSTPMGDVAFDEHGFIKSLPVTVMSANELTEFLRKIDIGVVD